MVANKRLPTAASNAGISGPLNLLRDSFTLPTLLFIGASLQAVLTLLPISPLHQIIPALAFVVYKMVDTLLIALHYKSDPQLATTKQGKFAASLAGDVNGDGGLCLLIIGVQVNQQSPMGFLAPGASKAANYFQRMTAQLEIESEEYGVVGITSCLQSERASRNATVTFVYFKTHDGLMRYARSPLHVQAWSWYNHHSKENPHIGVYHETYNVPAGNYEAIYRNMQDFGLGVFELFKVELAELTASGTYLTKDKSGNEIRQSTLVDARKGIHRTAEGRLTGKDIEEMDHDTLDIADPYSN